MGLLKCAQLYADDLPLQAHILFINMQGDDPQIVLFHTDDITLWVLALKRLKQLNNLIFLKGIVL